MTDRFHVRRPLYPIVSILAALLTLIGALALARSVWGTVFVAAVFVLLCLFGYASTCLKALPILIPYVGVFSAIFTLASGGNAVFTWQMASRLAGVGVAVLPGLSMPCGFDSKGLPIGAQLIGPHFGEGRLLNAAHAFQRDTDYHKQMPKGGERA